MKTKKTMTVYVPVLDETCGLDGYRVTLSGDQIDEAVDAGAFALGACKVNGRWYYVADETNEVYRLTRRDLATYGAGEKDKRGIDYSLWCNQAGQLVLRPSLAVKQSLDL